MAMKQKISEIISTSGKTDSIRDYTASKAENDRITQDILQLFEQYITDKILHYQTTYPSSHTDIGYKAIPIGYVESAIENLKADASHPESKERKR